MDCAVLVEVQAVVLPKIVHHERNAVFSGREQVQAITARVPLASQLQRLHLEKLVLNEVELAETLTVHQVS